jgi:apolipoprotein N-acyltransferase
MKTGPSSVIDAHGRVLAAAGMNQAGLAVASVNPSKAKTLYVRLGDWPLLLALLAVAWAVRKRLY